jgi:hypothetical protein
MVYGSDPWEEGATPLVSLGHEGGEIPETYRQWRDIAPWPQEVLGFDQDWEKQEDICEGLPEVHLLKPGSGGAIRP